VRQVPVDVEDAGAILHPLDHMRFPDFVEQRFHGLAPMTLARPVRKGSARFAKVFWFFFSKKNALPFL
jgi:hypothetical protein